MTTSTAAIRLVHRALAAGLVLHAADASGCPLTAGAVPVPVIGTTSWVIYTYPPPGTGGGAAQEANYDSASELATALVRRKLGAVVATRAAERAIEAAREGLIRAPRAAPR